MIDNPYFKFLSAIPGGKIGYKFSFPDQGGKWFAIAAGGGIIYYFKLQARAIFQPDNIFFEVLINVAAYL